jgi:siderophore synthetase component
LLAAAEESLLSATPTSSYRTVVVQGATPAMLKLSLGAVIAKTHRALTEEELVRALYVSRVMETIAGADRETIGVDWFREEAGVMYEGAGWMLRTFPPSMFRAKSTWLAPAFSLTPVLVELAGDEPEATVIEHVLKPYVAVLAHLLLEQGIELEAHAQNVLFELGRRGLTGRVVLRDFSDAQARDGRSVRLAWLRLVDQRSDAPPLPALRQRSREPHLSLALAMGRQTLPGREAALAQGRPGPRDRRSDHPLHRTGVIRFGCA